MFYLRIIVFWCCVLMLVQACTSTTMAPVEIRSIIQGQSFSPPPTTDRGKAAGSTCDHGELKVRKGDTLYGISDKCQVSLRALIDANTLKAPYKLSVGQRLVLPASQFHIVTAQQTLYSISNMYNVSLMELVRHNKLNKPYVIHIGQKLYLPGARGTSQAKVTTQGSSPPQSVPQQRPSAPQTADKPIPFPKLDQRPLNFVWPVKGRVISPFGRNPSGIHNDGINIAVRENTTVRASEAGTVVYADNGLKGFGNLILIKHKREYVTAYAHNSKMLFKRGDKIKRGQVIAYTGRSGGVKVPQLHFEIRQGSKAVNPQPLLKN